MILKIFVITLSVVLCNAIINGPNINRPCISNDLNCLRSYFRARARCGYSSGVPPAVFVVQESRFDTPAFNASYVDKDLVITGLCYVSEFYFNRQTNVNLLAVNCPNLVVESNRVMYQHYPAREDGIFRYFINGTYPMLTLTTPFYNSPLDLCREYSNVYVHALPIFNISPFDKPTLKHLTRDLAALGTFELETFAARANMLSRTVVNHMLCNFGCT